MPITGTRRVAHQELGDRRRDRLEDDREAAGGLERVSLLGDLRGLVGRPSLGPEAPERGRRLRCEADVAHHRHAGVDDRLRALDRDPAALELDDVAARLLDVPRRGLDRLLVRALVGAERQVAHQERRAQPAANGAGEDEHLVQAHRGGGRVAEHGHRRGVADQDQIHPGLLGDFGRREVVGRDHHDRLGVELHLRQARHRHLVSLCAHSDASEASGESSSTSGCESTRAIA